MNIIHKFILNTVLNALIKSQEVSKMLTGLKTALEGKKTYIVALAAILGVIIAWLNGTMGDVDAIKSIIEAILAITVRAGIAKV